MGATINNWDVYKLCDQHQTSYVKQTHASALDKAWCRVIVSIKRIICERYHFSNQILSPKIIKWKNRKERERERERLKHIFNLKKDISLIKEIK